MAELKGRGCRDAGPLLREDGSVGDVCICASKKMLMHVCNGTCTSAHLCVNLACCLLEQCEGSASQLPVKTGVELEGRGSLMGLGEVREIFIADFHMLIWHCYIECI